MARRGAQTGTLTLPWPARPTAGRRRPAADAGLWTVTVVLALIGLVMVFSASAVVAVNRYDDAGYFLKRQLAWLAFGFLLLHLASHMDYTLWRRLAIPVLAVTVLLLILVLIPGVGASVKGARRWLRLGALSIQPAEVAKLATVIYLAAYLTNKEARLGDFASGLLPPLVVLGVVAGLVVLEKDLGTVVVIGGVALGLFFLGGARLAHLTGLILVAAPVLAAFILSSPYRRQRLMTFLSPWEDPTNAGFQVTQSFMALGSGGLFGVGLGEGKQKLFFLPEAHTDFVLALVGEELGLFGTSAIMLLFAMLVIKGLQIAGRAREPFGRHLAAGVTLLIGLQALINAGVVTGLLPTKGLTLPLVSYGGSSLLVTLLAIGMLLSVSRDRQAGRPAK
ncbi:putative lipid II flippase FtsW [Nitrospira sp. Kam-Ns4a]